MNNSITSETLSESHAPILGTIAKFASPPLPDTLSATALRFYLQSLARELLPQERVAKCLRAIVPGRATVEIVADPARQAAHYKNLITCGRLWFCAVCATRITEVRAAELQQAVQRWQERGFVALLTYTLAHNVDDRIATVTDATIEAHRRFKAGKGFQTIKERFGWFGSIRALEVTYGENGWHPHIHELVFFEPMAADEWRALPDVAKARWLASLRALNRDASWEHGLDIRDADSDVYDYVAKYGRLPVNSRWTLEREVAKAPVKKAHEGGRTPFQLLFDYGDGDASAGKLFSQYAYHFKGRQQLVWSAGLRAELGMSKAQSDAEIAEQLPDPYVLLATLTAAQWRDVLRLPVDVRGELLDVARTGDRAEIIKFLAVRGVFLD